MAQIQRVLHLMGTAAAAAVRTFRLAEHAAAQHQHVADNSDQGHDPDTARVFGWVSAVSIYGVGGGGGRVNVICELGMRLHTH